MYSGLLAKYHLKHQLDSSALFGMNKVRANPEAPFLYIVTRPLSIQFDLIGEVCAFKCF